MTNLFIRKDFVSHSGLNLTWKIDCDALKEDDWAALAFMVSEHVNFGKVYGIPRGGTAFAEALEPYVTEGPTLIVDDVLTTGGSMLEACASYGPESYGIVVFARGSCPDWITPMFQYTNLPPKILS